MRNLKRVLSLALALVMVLGMMVITTSAADFGDAEEITYNEAVDVISALGIITGDNGKFYPNRTLTREEGAAFICYMLMGKANADKLVGSGNFTDVKADRWSAGEIDYCANLGLIAGVGNGKFEPSKPLTGVAFGRMLLGALGYDGSIEGYTGPNWASAITSDIVDANLDVKGVDLSAQLTREQAAQMAFQALTANMVYYFGGKGTSITLSDGTSVITGAGTLTPVANATNSYKTSDYTAGSLNGYNDNVQQFCEKYCKTLKKDAAAASDLDDFARPASYKWFVDANENNSKDVKETVAYISLKAPAYTVTAKSSKAMAAGDDGDDLVGNLNALLGLTGNAALPTYVAGDAEFRVNGAADADGTLADCDINAGDEIEVYVGLDGAIDHVIITRYTVAKVKSVTALTAAQIKTNSTNPDREVVAATSNVVLTYASNVGGADTSPIYNTKIVDFAYNPGQYIMVALKSDNSEVYASKTVETVAGTVSATKSSNYQIGDKFYGIATNKVGTVNAPDNGTKGEWVLDAAGKLAAVIDTTAKSSDYAYIYRITSAAGASADGYAGTNYTVYVVKADGTKASYPLATVGGNTDGNVYIKGMKPASSDTPATDAGYIVNATPDSDGNKKLGNTTIEQVVPYVINAKGEFEVIAGTETVTPVTASTTVDKTSAVLASGKYATNETKFVFVDNDTGRGKLTVSTADGYKNVKLTTEDFFAVTDIKGIASVVFVDGTAAALDATAGATLAVMVDTTPVITGTSAPNDPYIYTYSVIIDGELTTISKKSTGYNWASIDGDNIANGDIFYYTLNSAGEINAVTELTGETVVAVIDENNIQTSTAGAIDLTGVTQYTLTIDTTAVPATTYTVTEGAAYSATSGSDGYNVVVYSTGAGVKAIFVVNTIV